MKKLLLVVIVLAGLLAAAPVRAEGGYLVGGITRLQGMVTVNGSAAVVGHPVHIGDELGTGTDSRVEVKLLDESVLTLGDASLMIVDTMVYDPEAAGNRTSMDLIRGTFSAISGLIARAGGRMSVKTPVATIGIRGTTVWGGPLDGVFEIALFDGTAVEVTTNAGTVILDEVGEGTAVPSIDAPPTAAKVWGAPKQDRALATVAFR